MLLLAWPAVIGVGAILNHITQSHSPMACLPVIWLLVVACRIERMQLSQ